jgi:glycosyltransferase involved in cell wall biosynthesis
MRIVVTGLAITYPFGGVFWDYLQYVLGFHQLGHDVLYIEDTGRWCYSPRYQTFIEDGSDNASRFAKHLHQLTDALDNRWFYRDGAGHEYGLSWQQVVAFCRTADLFLHISAACRMREEYWAAKCVAFIDSDPMYTQASVPAYLDGSLDEESHQRIEALRRHDRCFTFGENIGRSDCRIPTGLFDWRPTRQPILFDHFQAARVPFNDRRRVLTTVASWEPAESGPTIDGVAYTGKSTEFRRMIDLPKRVSIPLELAISGDYPAEQLNTHGWQLIDAYSVSYDPWVYRDYLARSLGEWSVAKNAYVASNSGWFSCRSACYLALGVPVIVQNTGFDRSLPTGEGLLTFDTVDEAAAAVETLLSRPNRHAAAAVDLAAEYFDSNDVLERLLSEVSDATPARYGSRSAEAPDVPESSDRAFG